MYCQHCGTKLADGVAHECAATKSAKGLDFETLEKSIEALESVAKGVRPKEAPKEKEDKRTARQLVDDVEDEVVKYGDRGEGESEEEPESERGIERETKKGFPPPPMPGEESEDEEEAEEEQARERAREAEAEEARANAMPFKSAKKSAKKAAKSFADTAAESDNVRKAIDVSDFLSDLVYTIAEHTDSLTESVEKSLDGFVYQQRFNQAMASAMKQMGELIKGLSEQVQGIGKQPAATRKSDVSATVVEKSFANANPASNDTLSKSQIAAKLMTLMESGDKSVTDQDVIRAETTGLIRPELREKVGLAPEQK